MVAGDRLIDCRDLHEPSRATGKNGTSALAFCRSSPKPARPSARQTPTQFALSRPAERGVSGRGAFASRVAASAPLVGDAAADSPALARAASSSARARPIGKARSAARRVKAATGLDDGAGRPAVAQPMRARRAVSAAAAHRPPRRPRRVGWLARGGARLPDSRGLNDELGGRRSRFTSASRSASSSFGAREPLGRRSTGQTFGADRPRRSDEPSQRPQLPVAGHQPLTHRQLL